MKLVEIFVNDQAVAGEYIARTFFEWQGQEWEMTVKAASQAEAEALAQAQADAYLQARGVDQISANEKYGVYMF